MKGASLFILMGELVHKFILSPPLKDFKKSYFLVKSLATCKSSKHCDLFVFKNHSPNMSCWSSYKVCNWFKKISSLESPGVFFLEFFSGTCSQHQFGICLSQIQRQEWVLHVLFPNVVLPSGKLTWKWESTHFPKGITIFCIAQVLNVWSIYLHLGSLRCKCRYIMVYTPYIECLGSGFSKCHLSFSGVYHPEVFAPSPLASSWVY